MLLSAVSVLVVVQSSSEIPEGLMNNPVLYWIVLTCLIDIVVGRLKAGYVYLQAEFSCYVLKLYNLYIRDVQLHIYFVHLKYGSKGSLMMTLASRNMSL